MFPTTKIKAQLKKEDGIGKINGAAVDLVGNASAIFLQNIIKSTKQNHITEDILLEALTGSDYSDVIEIDNDVLLRVPRYKIKNHLRKRNDNTKKSAQKKIGKTIQALKSTLSQGNYLENDAMGQTRAIGLGKIIQDDEDYD